MDPGDLKSRGIALSGGVHQLAMEPSSSIKNPAGSVLTFPSKEIGKSHGVVIIVKDEDSGIHALGCVSDFRFEI
jgi:hypothetical protein